jgi:hypothetical protein
VRTTVIIKREHPRRNPKFPALATAVVLTACTDTASNAGAGRGGPVEAGGDSCTDAHVVDAVDTNSDPSNCGARGTVCGPVPVALGPRVSAFAIDGANIYWTQLDASGTPCNPPCAGAVMKMPLGGGTPLALASGQLSPISIAVGPTSVVWTNYGDVTGAPKALMTVPLDGGDPITLVADGTFGAYAVDATSVYYDGGGSLMKIPLAGGSPTPVTSLGVSWSLASGVVLDATSVYWEDASSYHGEVRTAPLAGGPSVLLYSPYSPPSTPAFIMIPLLAVDATNVYGATYDPFNAVGSIVSVPLEGGTLVTLASGHFHPAFLAVDARAVYWVNSDFSAPVPGFRSPDMIGTVMKAALTGGTPAVLASGQSDPRAIAVDAKNVYWANYGDGTDAIEVMTIPLDGGSTCQEGVCTAATW